TDVDHIIARPGKNTGDSFYLTHDYEGNYKFSGTIYCEKKNSKDFSDPVTVLYGHNMLDGSMFASLHNFENKEFFDKYQDIYIYTKGHILTYKIFAATSYSNRHILNTFDFSSNTELQEFIDDVSLAANDSGNINKDIEVTTEDNILVLSTCGNNSNYRYLVLGVLKDDELTE
ncbi:MAG: class B sortase, partial [Eubacterium sp.]